MSRLPAAAGPIEIDPEQGPTQLETRSIDVDELAQSLKVEIERAFADPSLEKNERVPPRPQTVEESAWQKTLGTIDGAATVAEALAKHIRRKATPRGPEEITDCRSTSVEKVVEVLEACSARLQEFRPIGSNAADLSILGPRPFASG